MTSSGPPPTGLSSSEKADNPSLPALVSDTELRERADSPTFRRIAKFQQAAEATNGTAFPFAARLGRQFPDRTDVIQPHGCLRAVAILAPGTVQAVRATIPRANV